MDKIMKGMARLIVAVIACLFVLSPPVDAGQGKLTVLQMPVHHSTGQLWLGKDGKLYGVRMQLLEALNRELQPEGILLHYKLTPGGELPISRCVEALARNEYQAYLGLGISDQRKKIGILYSSEPLYDVPNVVWILKKRSFPLHDHDSLVGKRVGVLQGSPILTDPALAQGILIDRSAETVRNNLDKLLNGRLDAIVDPITSTGTVVLEMGIQKDIAFCLTCLPPSRAFIAFSPSVPPEIRQQVNAAIQRLRYSGDIQRIMVGTVLEKLKKGLINDE